MLVHKISIDIDMTKYPVDMSRKKFMEAIKGLLNEWNFPYNDIEFLFKGEDQTEVQHEEVIAKSANGDKEVIEEWSEALQDLKEGKFEEVQ